MDIQIFVQLICDKVPWSRCSTNKQKLNYPSSLPAVKCIINIQYSDVSNKHLRVGGGAGGKAVVENEQSCVDFPIVH